MVKDLRKKKPLLRNQPLFPGHSTSKGRFIIKNQPLPKKESSSLLNKQSTSKGRFVITSKPLPKKETPPVLKEQSTSKGRFIFKKKPLRQKEPIIKEHPTFNDQYISAKQLIPKKQPIFKKQSILKKHNIKKPVKKKKTGYLFITTSLNNIFVVIMDARFIMKKSLSTGVLGHQGPVKSTSFAQKEVINEIRTVIHQNAYTFLYVYLRGLGWKKKKIINQIFEFYGEKIIFKDFSPISHKGCLKKKKKRL